MRYDISKPTAPKMPSLGNHVDHGGGFGTGGFPASALTAGEQQFHCAADYQDGGEHPLNHLFHYR